MRMALVPGGQPDGPGLFDWSERGGRLAARWSEVDRAAASLAPAEQLAVRRAALHALIQLTEQFPWRWFSHGPGYLREAGYLEYFQVPWRTAGIALEPYLLDVLELIVWWDEDDTASTWELFDGVPEADGEDVAEVFRRILGELERHGFSEPRRRLLYHWASFVGRHLRVEDRMRNQVPELDHDFDVLACRMEHFDHRGVRH